jgi:hypothetical protein
MEEENYQNLIVEILGTKPITFNPKLAKFIGSIKTTIFLSQLIYWKEKEGDENGWICKTREEITEKTGLSRREQEKARKDLIALGLLEEKYKGIPRRLYFLVKEDKLNEFILNKVVKIK